MKIYHAPMLFILLKNSSTSLDMFSGTLLKHSWNNVKVLYSSICYYFFKRFIFSYASSFMMTLPQSSSSADD